MNIKKIDDFVGFSTARAKGRFLYIKRKPRTYLCDEFEFRIIKRPRRQYPDIIEIKQYYIPYSPVLSTFDLNGFDTLSFVNYVLAKGNLEGCYYIEHEYMGSRFYAKNDTHLLHLEGDNDSSLFKKKSDVWERVLLNTSEKKFEHEWPKFKWKYETARNLARDVRREIYLLFRFFSDTALRSASIQLFGSRELNAYGKEGRALIKIMQTSNRIAKYSKEIDECVDGICNFLSETETMIHEKQDYHLRANCGTTGVYFGTVIDWLQSARIGNKQLLNNNKS